MIMPKNVIYDKRYYYTLADVLVYAIRETTPYTLDFKYSIDFLDPDFFEENHPFSFTQLMYEFGIKSPRSICNIDGDGNYTDKEFITELFQNILYVFYDEYVIEGDKDISEMSSEFMNEYGEKIINFLGNMINIMNKTYLKYSILYKGLQNNKDALLNKLTRESHSEGTGSGTNNRRDNDTPQDSGTFTDNTHTSFYTTGTDTNEMESDSTEIWDNEAIIDRLARIEEKMSNVMNKWVEEFSGLFIEGGNIHEI